MTDTSPYPREDDVICIRSFTVAKVYDFDPEPANAATGHVMTASFTERDRHLLGIGRDEAGAVTDLYRQLRDHRED